KQEWQLHPEREQLKKQHIEMRHVAKRRRAVPADCRLPGGQAQNPQAAEVRRAHDVMPRAARHCQPFTSENRPEQRSTPSTDKSDTRKKALGRQKLNADYADWRRNEPCLRQSA